MLKVLVIFDCHRPWHHQKAYGLMLNVAASLGIDIIVIIGDYADFYWVSRHPKSPRVFEMFKEEVESVIQGLDELDSIFPAAEKHYVCGNHEFRLESYLQERCPELFGFISYQSMVKLEGRPNWHFYPWSSEQRYQLLNTGLWFRHRPPATNPRNTLNQTGVSLIYGDVHKIEEAHKNNMDGKKIFTACGGWMGDSRKDQIFGYVKNWNQWQLGFSIVHVDKETQQFYYQNVPIKENMTCVVNGKLYKA